MNLRKRPRREGDGDQAVSDPIDRLIEMRAEIDAMIEVEERKRDKLRLEQLQVQMEQVGLVCANALALITKAKFHSDHAAQVAAVKKGLMDLARAA